MNSPPNDKATGIIGHFEWDGREERLPPCWIPRDDIPPVSLQKPRDSGRIYAVEESDSLRRKLLTAIATAEETICVASFLVADTELVKALLEASKWGRRVYLLTASEAQL